MVLHISNTRDFHSQLVERQLTLILSGGARPDLLAGLSLKEWPLATVDPLSEAAKRQLEQALREWPGWPLWARAGRRSPHPPDG